MKASPILAGICLLCAIVSAVLVSKSNRDTSDARINELVDARIAARERKFVDAYAPKFREMYMNIDAPGLERDWKPKSLEELLDPLLKMTPAP